MAWGTATAATVTDSAAEGGATGDTTETTIEQAADDVDVCAAIPADDVQAILTGADPITAVPNEVIPSSCDYNIAIGDESMAMDGAVVQIQLASPDAAFYDAQLELQQGSGTVTELDGVSQGFAFDEGGTILLTTEAGVWTVIRGVEIDRAATTQVTAEQLEAIAQLVDERL